MCIGLVAAGTWRVLGCWGKGVVLGSWALVVVGFALGRKVVEYRGWIGEGG